MVVGVQLIPYSFHRNLYLIFKYLTILYVASRFTWIHELYWNKIIKMCENIKNSTTWLSNESGRMSINRVIFCCWIIYFINVTIKYNVNTMDSLLEYRCIVSLPSMNYYRPNIFEKVTARKKSKFITVNTLDYLCTSTIKCLPHM